MATVTSVPQTDGQGETALERLEKQLAEARRFFEATMRGPLGAADIRTAFKKYQEITPKWVASKSTNRQLKPLVRDLVTLYGCAWPKVFGSGIISRAKSEGLLIQGDSWRHPSSLLAQKWDIKANRLLVLGCDPSSRSGWAALSFVEQCEWIEYLLTLQDALENPHQYGRLDFTDGVTKEDLLKANLSNRETLGKAIAACGIKLKETRSHTFTKEHCTKIAYWLYCHYKQAKKKNEVVAWSRDQLGVDVTITPQVKATQAKKK